MQAADSGNGRSPLDAALDVFRMRQYFDVLVRGRELATTLVRDAGFLDQVRRGVAPLPFDRWPEAAPVFPEPPERSPAALPGRVGVVSTGGSGALASLVGVARALEETGTDVSVYSCCSGSALFAFPLGAGFSAAEVAELIGSMRPRDYVDVGWREMATVLPTLGRGWAGLMRGQRLEDFFRDHLGDITLGELPIPTYAPIWNVEHNRIEYLGPRTYPDIPVARAIRMAVALPLFVQPVQMDGLAWCDGGLVDILPVHPVLDIEPAVDTAVALNGFYPPGFEGEDVTGWDRRPASILTAASQVRTCQQAQLARENLARLRAEADTMLVEPVPYRKVAGTGFYAQFIDPREWPEFMRAGRAVTLAALHLRQAEAQQTRDRSAAGHRPAGQPDLPSPTATG